MGDKSKIAWTDATWNPVSGCSKVSEGCRNCYAERDFPRLTRLVPSYAGRSFEDVVCHPDRLEQPLRWKRPRKIFVNSMSDLFHPDVPEEFLRSVFTTMALSSHHSFCILTKRPERMREVLSGWNEDGLVLKSGYGICLPNVWLGVSVEDQKSAEERIPILLETPAFFRWVSVEPMIGPVNLSDLSTDLEIPEEYRTDTDDSPSIALDALSGERWERFGHWSDRGNSLDWIVVGGESGPDSRPMEAEWLRGIIRECRKATVPLFVKQLGATFSDPKNGIAGASLKVSEAGIGLLGRRLKNRSGADTSEWADDLKIRECPGCLI